MNFFFRLSQRDFKKNIHFFFCWFFDIKSIVSYKYHKSENFLLYRWCKNKFFIYSSQLFCPLYNQLKKRKLLWLPPWYLGNTWWPWQNVRYITRRIKRSIKETTITVTEKYLLNWEDKIRKRFTMRWTKHLFQFGN